MAWFEQDEDWPFTLDLIVNDEAMGHVAGAGDYTAGHGVFIEAISYTGYMFVHWLDGDDIISEEASFVYIMPASDKSLTACFTPDPDQKFTLSLGISNDIDVTMIGAGEYITGESVNISVETNKAHDFVEWSSDDIHLLEDPYSQSTYLIMPNYNISFTAVFMGPEPYEVFLTVSPDYLSEHAGLQGSGIYLSGTMVTISAELIESYDFYGWTGDTGLLDNPTLMSQTFGMPRDNIELTAVYKPHKVSAIVSIEKNALKGIWKWTYGPSLTTWQSLVLSFTADKIMAGDITGNGILDLIIDIPDFGLLVYDLANYSWEVIAGKHY